MCAATQIFYALVQLSWAINFALYCISNEHPVNASVRFIALSIMAAAVEVSMAIKSRSLDVDISIGAGPITAKTPVSFEVKQ